MIDETPLAATSTPALADAIARGDNGPMNALFRANGKRAPRLAWSPDSVDLQNPILQRFHAKCQSMVDATGRVQVHQMVSSDFSPLSDWLMLLAPGAGQEDYVYSHYGKAIIETFGRDMTGKSTSDFGGYIATFFSALYRACAMRGEWIVSEHEPPASVFVRRWHRLIVPLYSGEDATHFAVANVPENELRIGLDLMVDPVFVCAEDQGIQYANTAAHRMFPMVEKSPPRSSLRTITGIDLGALPAPGEMVAQQMSHDSIELIDNGAIVERLVTTVSATEHRGQSFYIVVMRLIGS